MCRQSVTFFKRFFLTPEQGSFTKAKLTIFERFSVSSFDPF